MGEGVDRVFIGISPHIVPSKATPSNCKDPDGLANYIVDLYKRYDKPIVVSVNAGEYYSEFVSIMEKAGVPVYADIRSAVRSLEKFVEYHTL